MPKIETEAVIEKHNIIKPLFEYEGACNYITSGTLKYFNFIPLGTKIKITIEGEKDLQCKNTK